MINLSAIEKLSQLIKKLAAERSEYSLKEKTLGMFKINSKYRDTQFEIICFVR